MGWVCADFGCNVGGFTDCLLSRGATRVYAVDTGYGILKWSLRRDPRVVTMERTNALHVHLAEKVRLLTVDVGWTPQHLVLPRALNHLDAKGEIVSLVKPHYETDRSNLRGGVLPEDQAENEVARITSHLTALNLNVVNSVESPLRGDSGNREWLIHVRR